METTIDKQDAALGEFMASPFYAHWRTRVEATRGCLHPVRLAGAYQVAHAHTGELLHDHSGQVMVPCGTRRASVCPPCAERYAQDAYHLIRAGLAGDDTKGVATSVRDAPRLVLTLTAPSFGRVHSRVLTKTGKVLPCACGERHRGADTRISTPVDPGSYDYEHAVLWHANAGKLWHRFTTLLRRRLAQSGGIRVSEFKEHATVSYSKVAEYQRRGMIHFHAVIRVDGPDGPGTPAPDWITTDRLTEVVTQAASEVTIDTRRPDGRQLVLRFGDQARPEPILATGDTANTEQALAGYIAKYATKDSGATDSGVDKRIKSREHIELLSISEHYRRMMLTAWDLGGLEQYAHLNLCRWTHMLGFRGHFLTKSHKYSTTFKALRSARARYRFIELLDSLNVTEDETIVISEWDLTGVGHKTDAERELAHAIGERLRNQQQSKKELHVSDPHPTTNRLPTGHRHHTMPPHHGRHRPYPTTSCQASCRTRPRLPQPHTPERRV